MESKPVTIKKVHSVGKSYLHKRGDHEVRKEVKVRDDLEEDSYLGGHDKKTEQAPSHVKNNEPDETMDEPSKQNEEESDSDDDGGDAENGNNAKDNNPDAGSDPESESSSESENDEPEPAGVNTKEIVQWKDEYVMVHDDWNGAMARIVTVKPKSAGMKKPKDYGVIFFCVVKDICDIAKIKEVHYRKVLNQYFERYKRRFTLDGLTLLGMPVSHISEFFQHFDAAKIENCDSILKIIDDMEFFERDENDRNYFKKATRAKKDTEKGKSVSHVFFVFANFSTDTHKKSKKKGTKRHKGDDDSDVEVSPRKSKKSKTAGTGLGLLDVAKALYLNAPDGEQKKINRSLKKFCKSAIDSTT